MTEYSAELEAMASRRLRAAEGVLKDVMGVGDDDGQCRPRILRVSAGMGVSPHIDPEFPRPKGARKASFPTIFLPGEALRKALENLCFDRISGTFPGTFCPLVSIFAVGKARPPTSLLCTLYIAHICDNNDDDNN